jgi:hypothetical protein
MPSKQDTRHRKIGGRHRAVSRYAMLLNRVTNTETSRNKSYKGIEVRVSRDEFIDWFMPRDFEGCSVDRIEKSGHYELSNMQLISLQKNIAKDKLKHKDGFCICYSCKQEKTSDKFVADKRRMHTGLSTICKQCDSKRVKNITPEARERALEGMRMYYQRRKSGESRSTGK